MKAPTLGLSPAFLKTPPPPTTFIGRQNVWRSDLAPWKSAFTKSQVSFRRRRGFAYLWRPGVYIRSAVPVVMSLALPCEEASPRFKQIAHPSPRVWMHHLELLDSRQLDGEVADWMRRAYEAAGSVRRG